MYPNLYYFFRDVFGIQLGFLRFINSFGFFVAISFLIAAALLTKELRRKTKLGLFQPTDMKITVGKPATASEIILNFFLGFILGYKIIALFFLSSEATQDPQAFIFSGMGNIWAGLILGTLFGGLKWWERKKTQLPKPEERTVRIWPQDRVGEITIIALVAGLAGAKLFDIFENWSGFLKDPSSYIFSGGGLTFYGGLICATLLIIWYAKRHKITIRYLADAIAPSLMIAYALGRIGCQVAGDGDWGIYNSAYKVVDTHVTVAQRGDFEHTVQNNPDYFLRAQGLDNSFFPKPSALKFLPDWFFAYNYPHNVNEAGVLIPGCNERKFCTQLPSPVFPTPMYETMICIILFLLLWAIRKRLKIGGELFCIYLILNGMERFLIEKIRVNNRMNLFGLHPTQAEVISAGLVFLGLGLWIFLHQKYRAKMEGM